MPVHKPFNPLRDSALYFGSARQQKQMIDALMSATQQDTSGLHLVSGGSNSGKSYALAQLTSRLDKDKRFASIITAEEMEEGALPEGVPQALKDHLERLHEELYTQHAVYEGETASGKPLYIVVAHGETSPAERESAQLLKETAEIVRDASGKGYEVMWVADAPIMHQVSPIFKQTPYRKGEVDKFEKGVRHVEQEFPDVVHTHRLSYDTKATQESLWTHIHDYGQPFLDYLREETANWEKTKEWDAVTGAAIAQDRAAYDKAFAVLAKRAREQMRVAA